MAVSTAAIPFITLFGLCFSTLSSGHFLVVNMLTLTLQESQGQLDFNDCSINFGFCRPHNISVNCSLLTDAGFQTTVIHILAKLRSDMKNLADQINDVSVSVRHLVDGELEDIDLQLPDGLSLPMSSLAHMHLMQVSLDDDTFRKNLVRSIIISD